METEVNAREEAKKSDDKTEDKDGKRKKGGEDDCAYEGGDSQNEGQHKNGSQVNGNGVNGTNQNGQVNKLAPPANGLKANSFNEQNEGQGSEVGIQRNYYQISSHSTLPPSANPSKWQRNYDNLSTQDR